MINMPGALPTRDEAVAISLDVAMTELAPRLARKAWTVERCRKRILIASDRPVSYWAGLTTLDQMNGLGLEGAEEVRLPLDPQHLLVLRPAGTSYSQQSVEPKRFMLVNDDLVERCSKFIMASPHRRDRLREMPMDDWGPTLRFDIAPGTRVYPDGREEPMGDIVHMWTPRRS